MEEREVSRESWGENPTEIAELCGAFLLVGGLQGRKHSGISPVFHAPLGSVLLGRLFQKPPSERRERPLCRDREGKWLPAVAPLGSPWELVAWAEAASLWTNRAQ